MLKTIVSSNKSLSLQTVKKFVLHFFIITLLFISACTNTEKVLKSNDTNYKYTKALEWYNKGQYFKAIPVFEELMGLYKGSKTTEEVYYYYCMAQYKQGSYILSAFHFKNFVTKHPKSQYTEEALYMHAESYYKQSPKFNLDQSETYDAIGAYQTFINQYPESSRVADANNKIDELREKLEEKALRAAKLYYKTENYRAAAFAYKNLLIDFPDIDNSEEIQYKIVKSFYKYAEQSIATKQLDRYEDVIRVGNIFISRHDNSKFTTDVQSTIENSHFKSISSSLKGAMISPLKERNDGLEEVFNVYEVHHEYLKDEKLVQEAQAVKEQAQFEIVKSNFLQAQNAETKDKKKNYIKTIEAYTAFINTYNNSKYNKEALKYYNASQKNIKKLSNG